MMSRVGRKDSVNYRRSVCNNSIDLDNGYANDMISFCLKTIQSMRYLYIKTVEYVCVVFQIYVRSSDYNRTLMSAEVNLAGLFEPHGSQLWNQNLTWQPIPIHTVPRWNDPVCGIVFVINIIILIAIIR
jgi:hypothetical protein